MSALRSSIVSSPRASDPSCARALRAAVVSVALAALSGCAGGHDKSVSSPIPGTSASTTLAPSASSAAPTKRAKVPFENPGGMWMPEQLAEQAPTLRQLGLEIDPKELTEPTSDVLSAIVFLGGCSASFVSPEGLIITNHHCVQGALQYNSTPEDNLIEKGFLAKTRAAERSNGPASRVWITEAERDVTKDVVAGIAGIQDPRAREKTMEVRQKALVTACERGRPEIRCSIRAYYDGASYKQIEQLELRDIRLVYAPARGIGNFGGEVDNWRWPRHTGDFGFYRAYVGPDGKPADPSPSNVPYHPRRWLRPASTPLEEGDLVFVAGYPARTNRWRTAAEVDEAVRWLYPRRLAAFEAYAAALEALGKREPEAAIRGEPLLRGLHNALTNTRGQLDGLVRGGLMAEKECQQRELAAWIAGAPEREARFGKVLGELTAISDDTTRFREADATLREATRFSSLFQAATLIVRMAEERKKPDEDRAPDYQARNEKRHEQWLASLEKTQHRGVDEAMLSLTLSRALALPEKERSELVALVGGRSPTKASLEAACKKIFDGTTLSSKDTRLALFRRATPEELRASKDPMLRLAVKTLPLFLELEAREEAWLGRSALVRPLYVEAIRASSKVPLSPDANATLRITYGTVRGYKPSVDAPPYTPFTTLAGVVAKHTGTAPFDAPARLLDAARAGRKGDWIAPELGDVPVDFLADLHITGGNSGSATLNARGELVGLAFDGNYEAMASDWVFVPSITRSIHVDLRYIGWIMDAVDGAHDLLREMGLRPSAR